MYIYIYLFKIVTGICKKTSWKFYHLISIIIFSMLMPLYVFLCFSSKQRTILFNLFNEYIVLYNMQINYFTLFMLDLLFLVLMYSSINFILFHNLLYYDYIKHYLLFVYLLGLDNI